MVSGKAPNFFLVCFLLIWAFARATEEESFEIKPVDLDGRVFIPGGAARIRDAQIVATLDGGREIMSFCRKDGTFTIYGLPPGVHTLDVIAMGWHFPQVMIDVSSRGSGRVRAYYEGRRTVALPIPLELRGVPVNYFEVRKPFNLWSFIKSPTGMMMGVMAFGIIVFPMLKVDPEEYKQMKEMWSAPKEGTPQLQGRQKRE